MTALDLPLLDFRDGALARAWRPLHDGVMGGRSRGRSSPGRGAVRFEGQLSLENDGGFASFRLDARLPDLSGHDGLRLCLRGDGRTYKLSLRTDLARDGASWQAPVPTVASEWTTANVAFAELAPTWRGRPVTEAGPFDPSCIRQVGLVLADGQPGPFALELAWIDAGPHER